jgi:hypothetical protein
MSRNGAYDLLKLVWSLPVLAWSSAQAQEQTDVMDIDEFRKAAKVAIDESMSCVFFSPSRLLPLPLPPHRHRHTVTPPPPPWTCSKTPSNALTRPRPTPTPTPRHS